MKGNTFYLDWKRYGKDASSSCFSDYVLYDATPFHFRFLPARGKAISDSELEKLAFSD
jgi:hypothetical protein